MPKVTIVGAGQSGLQLGIGLLGAGFEVEILSNRTPEQIRAGTILSSQSMYRMALDFERALGLNYWDGVATAYTNVNMVIGTSGAPLIDWCAAMIGGGNSVDQRVKMPRWMQEFEARGGRLTIADAGIDELEQHAKHDDLVIVASGKGEIGRLFARDDAKCQFDQPMRGLALIYLKGMERYRHTPSLNINVHPGIGEAVTFPGYTTSGDCDIITFEAVPGGPMDTWGDVKTPADHLAMAKLQLERYFPWFAERCANVTMTDDNARLTGRFAPVVRDPVGRLPSGRIVFGLADAICLNDPITGQGSNNASKAAHIYMNRIRTHQGRFDESWMRATFAEYWDYARYVVRFTNTFLVPPAPHVLEIFKAAEEVAGVGLAFANSFDDPKMVDPWLYDADAAQRFIAAQRAAA